MHHNLSPAELTTVTAALQLLNDDIKAGRDLSYLEQITPGILNIATTSKGSIDSLRTQLNESKTDKAYVDAARRLHQSECQVEVDDEAIVSYSDDGGAYVQGWLWVPGKEAGIESGDATAEGADD